MFDQIKEAEVGRNDTYGTKEKYMQDFLGKGEANDGGKT
jgi:hypothetical protein